MKLGIIGSRKAYKDYRSLVEKYIFNTIVDFYGASGGNLTVVTGRRAEDGEGVDQAVSAIAERLMEDRYDITLKIHEPANERWEPDGYKDRNKLIVEESDVLVAFISKSSKTYGAGWTAGYAEGIGKRVIRVVLP